MNLPNFIIHLTIFSFKIINWKKFRPASPLISSTITYSSHVNTCPFATLTYSYNSSWIKCHMVSNRLWTTLIVVKTIKFSHCVWSPMKPHTYSTHYCEERHCFMLKSCSWMRWLWYKSWKKIRKAEEGGQYGDKNSDHDLNIVMDRKGEGWICKLNIEDVFWWLTSVVTTLPWMYY
jgi:hypothetical protein